MMPAEDNKTLNYEQVSRAISTNDTVALKGILLENGVNLDLTFDSGPQFGKTALHLCCESNAVESAQLLIQHGASVNVIDKWNQTPLMYAVCAGSQPVVSLLLGSHCDINRTDRFHKTALHYAVSNESADILESLLKAGCELNARDSHGCTTLWSAVSTDGHVAHVKLLIQAGADVTIADTQDNRSPLQTAIMHTKVDTLEYVRLLLDAGCPLNSFDRFGHSILMAVIRRNWQDGETVHEVDMQLSRIILNAGHDINIKHASQNWTHYGGTALMMAVERGAPDLVKLFLEAHANPDLQDEKGVTPLLIASQLNYIDIGKLLVDAGCRLDLVGEVELDSEDEEDSAAEAKPPQKITAEECARRLHNTAFVDMLLKQKGSSGASSQ